MRAPLTRSAAAPGAPANLRTFDPASTCSTSGSSVASHGGAALVSLAMITYLGLDHVQMAAPLGAEPQARAFYGEILGLREIPKPPELAKRGGAWFVCGAQQLHVGAEEDFHAARKAHPALALADRESFEELAARLATAGHEVRRDHEMEPAVVRFFTSDPWGNRIEIVFHQGALG